MSRFSKITAFIFIAVSLFACSSCDGFLSCNNKQVDENTNNSVITNDSVIKDPMFEEGYVFNKSMNWYEVVSGSEIKINLTQSKEEQDGAYFIEDNYTKVTFIGKARTNYTNFAIVVAKRTTDIQIEFQNFSYTAPAGKVGLDASKVNNKVSLFVSGICSVTGGRGKNGASGSGYNTKSYTKNVQSRSGDNGSAGTDGSSAVVLNSGYIYIDNAASEFCLTGGKGGNGGNGGNGEGSQNRGRATAGNGGNGAKGGNGGIALIVGNLDIENNGELMVVGGNGGDGGNGGNGGENMDTAKTAIADNGGKGGNGGRGGNGGKAFYSEDNSITLIGEAISFVGGDGGNGGNGGNGGSSCRTGWIEDGSGGTPGVGGSAGYYGSGAACIEIDLENIENVPGKNGSKGSNGQSGSK